MVERGLVLGGLVVPDTDWIIRDPAAWWHPNDPDRCARPRGEHQVEILCAHWTAGEAGSRRADDDGPFVYRVMRNRPSMKVPGQKLRVSIHFVIGASGDVWQTADPMTTVAMHVGTTDINSRSIGVEIVNKGAAPALRERPRKILRHIVAGVKTRQLAFYDAQLRAYVDLAELLVEHIATLPRQIPSERTLAPFSDTITRRPLTKRFTRPQSRRWRGAMEHYLDHATHKLDAGTQTLRALADAGWAQVDP